MFPRRRPFSATTYPATTSASFPTAAPPTIYGNTIYDNLTGLQGSGTFGGTSWAAGQPNDIHNNTIYQPVGDAVGIQSSSGGIALMNNILWTQAGYDLYVATDSQTNFQSDYNLFFLGTIPAPQAHLGFWNNTAVDLNPNPATPLFDWQSSSARDNNCVYGDPQFVNIKGADNSLGYDPVHNYDGGADDNFELKAHSPAIDRGDAWVAPATDLLGNLALMIPAPRTTARLITQRRTSAPASSRRAGRPKAGGLTIPTGTSICRLRFRSMGRPTRASRSRPRDSCNLQGRIGPATTPQRIVT